MTKISTEHPIPTHRRAKKSLYAKARHMLVHEMGPGSSVLIESEAEMVSTRLAASDIHKQFPQWKYTSGTADDGSRRVWVVEVPPDWEQYRKEHLRHV